MTSQEFIRTILRDLSPEERRHFDAITQEEYNEAMQLLDNQWLRVADYFGTTIEVTVALYYQFNPSMEVDLLNDLLGHMPLEAPPSSHV